MTMSFEDPRVDRLEKIIEEMRRELNEKAETIAQQSALLALQDDMMDAARADLSVEGLDRHQLHVGQIANPTDILGEEQGFRPLPISRTVGEDGTIYLLSAWEFTDEQRAMIAEGAPLILSVMARAHPPVGLMVGMRQRLEDIPETRTVN